MFTDVAAQVKLPKLIGDSMILQRDAKLKIWGWAAAKEKVTIHFNNKTYNTITAQDGMWMITLMPMHAGGPYDMQIDAGNRIIIKNILIGDVWVCSGQSNMEMTMQRLQDKYPEIIAAANNRNIRQFNVSTKYNFQSAQEDLASGSWQTATPQSVLQFTAVGYFFAKTLYEKYHVPVGLIKSAVGGSPAEAWLSADALKQFPSYLHKIDTLRNQSYVDSVIQHDNANSNTWYNNIFQKDQGLHESTKWYDTSYNASTWQTMHVPGYWNNAGLPNTNGVVWFRKEFNAPLNILNRQLRLFLGTIVDRDSVYINGTFIGTTQYQYPPRKYIVPAGLLKEGKNFIVVRVINYAGSGGFTKDKPYKLFSDKDTIDLTGTWQFKLGAASEPIPSSTTFNYMPGGLYNAMISPLINYSIKAVIWYQGEANTSRALEYEKLFPAVIQDWRNQWLQNFPFIYVQLANFMQAKEQPSESNWAALRQAQLKTLAVEKTAMAVTIDLGEWNDIHPLNKEDVGKRLTLAAQKMAYKENIVYSGPIYRSMKIERSRIIISFRNMGSGLMAKNGVLKYFSIAGADKKFVWANAVIEKNKVIVWNDSIKNPVAVRYAWADNPEGANLYNKEGLPASPFATDK